MAKIKGKIWFVYEHSFTTQAAKWNKLPMSVATEENLTSFKTKLDKWLSSIPDKPPVQGYSYNHCLNSILDYTTSGNR